jgi:hypothetical protein
MSFNKAELDDLAVRYTDAWNSKLPENVAAFYVQGGQISINLGADVNGQGAGGPLLSG